jgi:succinate-semialdehyde dehydrogenase/glutarate-semialdehyde dehydrogenase
MGRCEVTPCHAQHLIGGRWIDTGRPQIVRDPADGSEVGTVASGSAPEARAAADAAAGAAEDWGNLPPRSRARLLMDAADAIDERADELGLLLAREAGKRLPEAVGEVRFSAEYFRWFAEQVRRPVGEVHPHESLGRRHLSVGRPAGVVASLTPWNFPCSIQARKLAPALAAGCTVVARVSEKAPLAVTDMIRCLVDAGVPDGVVNLVHGPAGVITETYLAHPAVRVVTFTGSTEIGRVVMRQAANRVVRPLLELGGNAPFIVFEDADLDRAIEGAMLAKFRNTGQSCIGANRFLVHESVVDEFSCRFAAEVDAMRIGPGAVSDAADLGPCIDADRVDAVNSLVSEALSKGAKRLTQERVLPPDGAFCEPALLADVPANCALVDMEVFGPAASISTFSDERAAMSMANATEMGLASYVYTRDHARVWRVADMLDTGIIGINDPLPSVAFAPMGGTKQSGIGREGGVSGLEEFQQTRYLAMGI